VRRRSRILGRPPWKRSRCPAASSISRRARRRSAPARGTRLTRRDAGALRDDVSTDEITPVPILTHYDDKLGRYPYTGLSVAGQRPIGVDAVRAGGFSVTVAGKRYGKGSSREHSPAAERLAGIRLVVAESFERIYRQNADNIGLFTSTGLRALDRIEAGESLAIDELVQGRDALAAAILTSGGLLPLRPALDARRRPAAATALAASPRTLFEKIVARHALSTELTPADPRPGEGAFVRADWRFIHEYYTGCARTCSMRPSAPRSPCRTRPSIVAFEDHTSYVAESPAHVRGGLVANVAAMCRAHRAFVERHRCARTARSPSARPRSTTAATSPASRTR
jgi:3-isopropylmalate/(R)-2-methylmalate dehydratase large subunit